MTRRQLFTVAAATVAAPMVNLGHCRLFGAAGKTYSTRVVDLVARSVVIDMLGLLTMDWPKLARWHENPSTFRTADFEQVQRSSINVLNPAVELGGDDPFAETTEWLDHWRRFIDQNSNRFALVNSCSELTATKRSGRVAILLGMQNSEHFRTTSDVGLFHAKGQRISQLTYNSENRLGSGCGERRDGGLTDFGGEIIRAMNMAGMAVDVSHAGERTTLDAIKASDRPLLITHSNCRALVPHPRCKSNEVIRAMAHKGGVMGITGVRTFLSRRGGASIEDVLDHFDHVAKLVGVEHLGIGSDAGVDGGRTAPHLDVHGLDQPRRVFDLTEGLVRRRYSDAAITGILGGNFERAMETIFCPNKPSSSEFHNSDSNS
jgi:membrane dipeptidase